MSTNNEANEETDTAWECPRCAHVNDGGEECMSKKCVDFRAWAAAQPQEDEA